MEIKRWCFLVSGLVQGVYYRASTQTKAVELGLTGYARNLPDGRVEVVAEGTEDKLTQLKTWCDDGPLPQTWIPLTFQSKHQQGNLPDLVFGAKGRSWQKANPCRRLAKRISGGSRMRTFLAFKAPSSRAPRLPGFVPDQPHALPQWQSLPERQHCADTKPT